MVKVRHRKIRHWSSFGLEMAKIPSGEWIKKGEEGGGLRPGLGRMKQRVLGCGVQVESTVGFKSVIEYKACLSYSEKP